MSINIRVPSPLLWSLTSPPHSLLFPGEPASGFSCSICHSLISLRSGILGLARPRAPPWCSSRYGVSTLGYSAVTQRCRRQMLLNQGSKSEKKKKKSEPIMLCTSIFIFKLIPSGFFSDSDILNCDPNKYLSWQQHINQLMTSLVTYKLQGSEVKN